MKSGQIVMLLLVIFIAGVCVLAVFLWQKEHTEEMRLVNEQLKTRYEETIDSLQIRIKMLETKAAVSGTLGDTLMFNLLFDEIDFLRSQVSAIAQRAMAYSGEDSVTFFIRHLGDSMFVSHYGDYEQPKTWYIAPERLGMMGRLAIAPLIRHLDSAEGFEFSQTLYALNLASQHGSVKTVTGGRLPPIAGDEGDPEAAIRAWKQWAQRYNF